MAKREAGVPEEDNSNPAAAASCSKNDRHLVSHIYSPEYVFARVFQTCLKSDLRNKIFRYIKIQTNATITIIDNNNDCTTTCTPTSIDIDSGRR
jgi:hypothetical protein